MPATNGAQAIELPLHWPAIFFVKVRGKGAFVRELPAIIDTSATYVVMTRKMAAELGYVRIHGSHFYDGEFKVVATIGGLVEGAVIELRELAVGPLRTRQVQTMLYELPETGGVEIVLGQSFLRRFNLTFNPERGVLRLERPKTPASR